MNTEVVSRLREVFRGFDVGEDKCNQSESGLFGVINEFPITTFYMRPEEILRFAGVWFPFTVETVVGVMHDDTNGVIESIQIRTPLSCVEDSSYNKSFVKACWNACDLSYTDSHCQLGDSYNITLHNGLAKLFSNINEQSFLGLNSTYQKQSIIYFMQQLAIANNFIRDKLRVFGYVRML